MNYYTGPWAEVRMSDGSLQRIKGTSSDIAAALQTGQFQRFETVEGRTARLAPDHVRDIKPMPPPKGDGFRQVNTTQENP